MFGPVSTFHHQRTPHRRQTLSTHGLLEQKSVAPPRTDEPYDEEYVINNIIPHYKLISKHGCLSNHVNQPEREMVENERNVNK